MTQVAPKDVDVGLTLGAYDAGQTRERHFRRTLHSPEFWMLTAAVAVALTVATVTLTGSAFGALIAIGVVGFAIAFAFVGASSSAEADFFADYAQRKGWSTGSGMGQLMRLQTPLFDTRSPHDFENVMKGPLDALHPDVECLLAHFRFNPTDNDRGNRYTVCVVEVPDRQASFPMISVAPRRDPLEQATTRVHSAKATLESSEFTKRFDLRVSRPGADARLQEFFSPTMIAWLLEHPDLQFELEHRTLVVIARGRLADQYSFDHLVERTRELAARIWPD